MYINRLKQKVKTLDYALMLKELNDCGYSSREIEKFTGISNSTARKTASDSQPVPEAWHEAAYLIDAYLMITHKNTLPFI